MKQRVLVIDDDKLVADTLSLIFLANGFQSEARCSAAQTRMLMLTAYSSNASRVEAQSSRLGRPLKLLCKPCRPELLLRTATEMLATA